MKSCKIWVAAIIFCVSAFTASTVSVNAKNIKTLNKNIMVMEGATRLLTNDTFHATYKVTDKKIVTVIKDRLSSYSTVVTQADSYEYGFLIKGKTSGITKITVTTAQKKYIYTVTVVPKKSIQKAAKKALTKYADTLKNTNQCAYMDFNGDGVKELYHDGYFSYYNYVLKKVVTKPFSNKSITKVSSLLVAPKSHLMFAIPSNELLIGDPDPDYAIYSGSIYGCFAFFNEEKVFDLLSNVYFLKYQYPESFVGDTYVKGTDYYCLQVPGYDQDDYWYEAYTKKEMDQKITDLLPHAISVIFTTKPEIK